jgi:hypothetical protein
MGISVYDVTTNTTTSLGTLNPTSEPGIDPMVPFTSGGYQTPPAWIEVQKNLDAFSGHTIRLVFSFDTKDTSINGFRGFVIDNVRVATDATP